MKQTLSSFFSKNRLEENSDKDLWGKYVLPLDYQDILHLRKSSHITGGRGSGKTAYLQYHCYPTILSKKKKEISPDDLASIGIYWKPDDDMLSDMTENVLGPNWNNAFNSYFGISILIELSRFLKTFLESPFQDAETKRMVEKLELPSRLLESFGINENISFINFEEEGHYLRSKLIEWLCFPSAEPIFKFKAKDKIEQFIRIIKKIDIFKDTKFHIFIDEFENLSSEQQKLINTWIKFVGESTIVNVAYKAHYEPESETIGNEKIQQIHDYSVINIELDLYGDNFELLASEIVLSRLQEFFNEKFEKLQQYNKSYLSDENSIEFRKTDDYQRIVKEYIKQIFPIYQLSEISEILVHDSLLMKKIKSTITKALQNNKEFQSSDFIDLSKPQETILNAILLNRESIQIDKKKITIKELHEVFTTDTSSYSHWKDINLLGAMLFFYNTEKYHRVCPYYGGFNRFILQSAYNTRHLIELAHHSFSKLEQNKKISRLNDVQVPIEMQAESARIVSTYEFDRKIAFLGKHGTTLKRITERLGKLFALVQNNPAQSFAEVVQFSIIYSSTESSGLTEEDLESIESFIKELKMWSVIIEYDNSKILNKQTNNSLKEYRLHPILSSYFGISPRKKRKLDLTMDDIKIIFFGKDEEYTNFYIKRSSKNIPTKKLKKLIQPVFEGLS
jgi:hypothetical protein